MKSTCSIPMCLSPKMGLSEWCKKHYTRHKRHGDPLIVLRAKNLSTEQRFWQRVKKTQTCWIWTGCVNSNGYGQMRTKGEIFYVHRYSYFLANGRWPKFNALHSCDTPRCVRPSHLSDGTQAENMKQMALRGRSRKGRKRINEICPMHD